MIGRAVRLVAQRPAGDRRAVDDADEVDAVAARGGLGLDTLAGIRPRSSSPRSRRAATASTSSASSTRDDHRRELRDEPDGSTDHAEWIPFAELDALPLVDLVPGRARLGPLSDALDDRHRRRRAARPGLSPRPRRDALGAPAPPLRALRVVRREADGVLVCDFVARRVIARGSGRASRSPGAAGPGTSRRPGGSVPPRRRRDEGHGRDLDDRAAGDGRPRRDRARLPARVPGFAAFVDRAFTRPIAGRTLATMRPSPRPSERRRRRPDRRRGSRRGLTGTTRARSGSRGWA